MSPRKKYQAQIVLAFSLSLLLTLLLVIPSLAQAQDRGDEPYRIERFSQSAGELLVETSGGHITVRGSDSDEVRVEMFVTRNGRNLLPDDTSLDEYEIEIAQSGNRVSAIARRENDNNSWRFWRNNRVSVSFVVHTPETIETNLRTSGGHITVRGITGTQELRTSGGHLELADMEGTVNGRTSGGHISVAQFTGTLGVRTSGGHIEARDVTGDLEMRTSGGHIELANAGGTVDARTSGGSIRADLNSIGESVTLRTSGGHITIGVPDGIGLDLALRGSRVQSNLDNFSGVTERNQLDGSVNGGGPSITARTSGGTVRIGSR